MLNEFHCFTVHFSPQGSQHTPATVLLPQRRN